MDLFGGEDHCQALPSRFHPQDYGLDRDVSMGEARAFVKAHHYLATVPNSTRFVYGMRYRPTWRLVGVASFGSPSFGTVLPSAFPGLRDVTQVASELSRLVLHADVPKNGESWFVRQAFRDLEKRGQRGVVAFADPRYGHVGGVYQALEGWHTGMSKPGKIHVLPDGTELHPRQYAKIRAADKVWAGCHGSGRSIGGWGEAVNFVVAHGAEPPVREACLQRWLESAITHTPGKLGKYRYVWGLDPEQRRRMREYWGPVDYSVYPKLCHACRRIVGREHYDRDTSLCLDCVAIRGRNR